LFPKLTSRSSFAKQSSNLWHVKQLLQGRLNEESSVNAQCFIVDGFLDFINFNKCFRY